MIMVRPSIVAAARPAVRTELIGELNRAGLCPDPGGHLTARKSTVSLTCPGLRNLRT